VILTSFGDMLRVPGSSGSLLTAKAEGADVRMVYSPLEALRLAEAEPTREVVFFAVGFETTAPANAAAVDEARRRGLPNFSILAAHVRVPPAMEAILGSPGCRVRGFLAAGHVCTVMGFEEYEPIADRYRVPIVVTGFEPLDLLQGIYLCCRQLERGEAKVENQYTRAVRREGNRKAQELMRRVFSVGTQTWRGIGEIPGSGLVLAPAFEAFDAERKFGLPPAEVREPESCRSGQVLQGLLRPNECPEFAGRCTPETPLGAPMVSSEGACAAYFLYGRKEEAR
jgi:hydrogenase expression/formation protein HypD